MVKKKVKKSQKPSWETIGKMTGKKFGEEFKGGCNCDTPWQTKMYNHHCDGGFFGRALFAIGVLIALNMAGIMTGIPTWLQVLIGAGFALMKF